MLLSSVLLMYGCYTDLSDVKDKDYSGIVTRKYNIWQNNKPYISVLQNGKTKIEVEIVHYQSSGYQPLADYIEAGDSIYKPKGKYTVVVYKFAEEKSKVFHLWLGDKMYTDE